LPVRDIVEAATPTATIGAPGRHAANRLPHGAGLAGALFARKAKASKLTVNEFVRRAAEAYEPGDDDEALNRLVAQVKQTTREATTALDAALKACAESNRRIAGMEAAHAARSAQAQ